MKSSTSKEDDIDEMYYSDDGSDGPEETEGAVPRKKYKRYNQRFSSGWLTDSHFKDWIEKKKHGGNAVPYCRVCKTNISCAKTALARHSTSKSHKEAIRMASHLTRSQPSIRECFSSSADTAAKMEIKLCSFIAEHNLPISHCENLLTLLRSLFPFDDTLKKVTLAKQKATNTIRQVLGFHYMMEGIEKLQSHQFSLITDETTDRSTEAQLAILGTYFDAESFKITIVFIDMIKIPDGTADTIYTNIIKCLQERNIPMKRVIGFCADTCNVMFGKHHSVSQMLVRDHSWILPVKCSCHMIHLCITLFNETTQIT